jgi:excisionase family DNA binding protein
MMPQKLLYTVGEAQRLLSLGNTKFYQEVRAGRLSIVKVGGKSLVPQIALYAYVDALVKAGADHGR